MDSNEKKAISHYLKNLTPNKKKTNQLKYAEENGRKHSDVADTELYKNFESKTKVLSFDWKVRFKKQRKDDNLTGNGK